MKFAFISRHEATPDQIRIVEEMGHELVSVGDADAFSLTVTWVEEKGDFDGVVVVHPAAALNLIDRYAVGIFKNENRAPIGAPPQFKATELHIWGFSGGKYGRIFRCEK